MSQLTSARAHARALGLRVADGKTTGRVSFERTGLPGENEVRLMWLSITHARTGEPPYASRQPFAVIEAIVDKHGYLIWGRELRTHLLQAGERPEYPSDLFWPEDRQR